MEATNRRIIHVVATCCDCDWKSQDYLTARRKAYAHALKTGHKVIIETCNSQTYNPKEAEMKKGGEDADKDKLFIHL